MYRIRVCFSVLLIKCSCVKLSVFHSQPIFFCIAAKSLQSCLTLCDPIDGSPPASPVPGILQARILEWVAISFSNAWKWKVKVKSFNRVRLLATPWTAAHQAPPSMEFARQEYWSGLPLPGLKCSKRTNIPFSKILSYPPNGQNQAFNL